MKIHSVGWVSSIGVVSWAVLFGTVGAGWGTTISMDTTARGVLSGDQASVSVECVNRGDEKAMDVRFEARFPDLAQLSPSIERMEPNAKTNHTFGWKMPSGARYRQIVVPILTHYADANLYPFSAVSFVMAADGTRPPEAIAAKTVGVSISQRGAMDVRFRSLDGRDHDLAVRVVGPKEVAVETGESRVKVPASGEVSVKFGLSNFAGLPGSSYALLIVASEQGADGVVETALVGRVTLVSGVDRLRGNLHWIAPSAIVLLWMGYWGLWARRRGLRRRSG